MIVSIQYDAKPGVHSSRRLFSENTRRYRRKRPSEFSKRLTSTARPESANGTRSARSQGGGTRPSLIHFSTRSACPNISSRGTRICATRRYSWCGFQRPKSSMAAFGPYNRIVASTSAATSPSPIFQASIWCHPGCSFFLRSRSSPRRCSQARSCRKSSRAMTAFFDTAFSRRRWNKSGPWCSTSLESWRIILEALSNMNAAAKSGFALTTWRSAASVFSASAPTKIVRTAAAISCCSSAACTAVRIRCSCTSRRTKGSWIAVGAERVSSSSIISLPRPA